MLGIQILTKTIQSLKEKVSQGSRVCESQCIFWGCEDWSASCRIAFYVPSCRQIYSSRKHQIFIIGWT